MFEDVLLNENLAFTASNSSANMVLNYSREYNRDSDDGKHVARGKKNKQMMKNTGVSKKVELIHKDFSYNLVGFGVGTTCILLLVILMHLIEAPAYLREIKQVSNQNEVFNTIIDLYNDHVILQGAINSMIVWNDESPYVNKKASEVVREGIVTYKKRVITRMMEYRSWDLGTFTEFYNNVTGSPDYKLCDDMKKVDPVKYSGCGKGVTNIFNSNYLTAMKALISSIEVGLSEWESEPYPQNQRVLRNAQFKAYQYMAHLDGIIFEMYMVLVVPLQTTINARLQRMTLNPPEFLENKQYQYLLIYTSTFVLAIACIYRYILVPLEKTRNHYWAMLLLIPLKFIKANQAFYHYYQRCAKEGMRLNTF